MSELKSENVTVRKLAIATAVVSLLPIGMGSLVTTLGAGMAFPDWPTSDGQGMLTYPIHLAVGHQFVEHGHRLAGVLIGLFSIALCVVAWATHSTRGVKAGSAVVLTGVIIQGGIGGLRVLMDQKVMAYAHSVFGCCVFVALCLVVLMSGNHWRERHPTTSRESSLRIVAFLLPGIALLQYVLGGAVRHFGAGLDFHIAGALATVVAAIAAVGISSKCGSCEIRRVARFVGMAVLCQIALGVGTWITKYGLPSIGFVAIQDSISQVVFRTVHTVAGMAVVASSFAWGMTVIRTTGAFRATLSSKIVAV